MASSPITSWLIDGEKMETVTDFIFLGSKIIADGDCSHEIKRHLLLRWKVTANLDSILKSRDITLPTKVRKVKTMVFPVVTYRFENWTSQRRLNAKAFMLLNCGVGEDPWEFLGQQGDQASQSWCWCWRKGWCWSWTSNTLATWCEESTHWKRPWCWERLRAWGEGDDRGWDGWMASLPQWTGVWAGSGRQRRPEDTWCAAVRGAAGSGTTEALNNKKTSYNRKVK